jgi:hypothetical protein
MFVKDATKKEENGNGKEQANNRKEKNCVAKQNFVESIAPRVIAVNASRDRIDAATAHEAGTRSLEV